MDHKDVLDWKINSLANRVDDNTEIQLMTEMEAYIAKHPELTQELAFIEQFWQNKTLKMEQPSSQLDANFYQMLSTAQAVQHTTSDTTKDITQEKTANIQDTKMSFFDKIQLWFSPRPLVQFATLGFVFVVGFNLSSPKTSQNQELAFNGLKKEVSSLSTMLAVSMLQKNSASERLTGVAYSKQSDLTNPILLQQLIDLIEHDKSTAVRLAIIKTLNTSTLTTSSEQRLLAITEVEPNVMVQIELYRLLLSNGNSHTRKLLTEKINQQKVKPEVRNFLLTQLSTAFI